MTAAAPRNDRDTLLAVVSGVAVGLLALTFPSPIAFLGLIPAVIAALDLLRRGQQTAVGVLLVAAALAAGLPSGYMLFGMPRAAGEGVPAETAAVFGVACGALILGVMMLLLEQDEGPAASATPATPDAPAPADEPPPADQPPPAEGADQGA
ncbi:MAG TPA: hypothetical protein VMH24_04980 [Candidatus Sulfotelmatobacter sp.]|nr:hypothetical protein [Candidatus Sulfotelmatobacter sp.]